MNEPGSPETPARPEPPDGARGRPSASTGAKTVLVRGGLRFVSDEQRRAARERLAQAGVVMAEVDGIDRACRGRLAAVVDEAIERALARGGAGGQGLGAALDRHESSASAGHARTASDLDAWLGDQLYRARRIGARGIAVSIGPLRATADAAGVLAPEDCILLRLLAAATRDRPVFLLIDAADAQTGGYDAPVPLEQVLGGRRAGTDTTAATPARPESDHAAISPPAALPPTVAVGAVAPSSGFTAKDAGSGRAAAPDRSAAVAASTATLWPGTTSGWAQQLTQARGPQPLAALERLFCESYVPLDRALAAGLDDPRARAARDEFRSTFVRSYTDAFATFAATTKRPRMVLDAHEVAGRIARLHGARSVRLLLVDAMRWDIGRQIQERLTARLGARAALADEVLLWSALPTVTMRQLETLARGVEALRSPSELDAEAEPLRGRTAEYVRRLRVGPREIHKLDLVETRLHAARGAVLEAMTEIADETAEVIARQADNLAPHTLLFVFGDHGFTLDRHGSAQQGGASPEEVLVGGFALLVGDVH